MRWNWKYLLGMIVGARLKVALPLSFLAVQIKALLPLSSFAASKNQ